MLTMYINMKKICFYLLICLCAGSLFSQDKGNSSSSLSGFDGLQWGTEYKEAKERFRVLASSGEAKEPVSIIADKPENEIKIERTKLVYRYLFYKKPEILLNGKKPPADNSGNDATQDNKNENKTTVDTNGKGGTPVEKALARLFLVESTFSYVPAEELYKKIAAKYGSRNGGKVDDKSNRGYYLWNLDKGYIIQWIDPYKKMPFTRSIYYLSKEIIEEIRVDFPKYQYSKELRILKDILY